MLCIGEVLPELIRWLLPATRRFHFFWEKRKIWANTRCYVFGFHPPVFRQSHQDSVQGFYAATVPSVVRTLDFCGPQWKGSFCDWCFVLRQGLCSPGSPWTGEVYERVPPCQANMSGVEIFVSFSHAQAFLSDSFLWDKSHSGAQERKCFNTGSQLETQNSWTKPNVSDDSFGLAFS